MDQVFNKGLDLNERKEGLLKRLKNIEDKTDKLNNIAVVSASNLKKIDFYNPKSEETRKLANEINEKISKIK